MKLKIQSFGEPEKVKEEKAEASRHNLRSLLYNAASLSERLEKEALDLLFSEKINPFERIYS